MFSTSDFLTYSTPSISLVSMVASLLYGVNDDK
jgi:hypothetical protein